MSTTTHHRPSPLAPWRSTFESHISSLPSPEFVFATLAPSTTSPHPSGTEPPTPYVPRLRYCIYRGMWSQLPENKHNTAPQNPRVYDSDMPTFTTDVRMQKVGELFASSAGKAAKDEQVQGSGGGGPCEAAFWVKEKGTQWRIKGTAFVVGPDIEGGEESSGVRTVKSEVGGRMRVVEGGEGKERDWSWGRELTAHFGNCSPGMRGSWKNPPPGRPVRGEPDQDHQLAQKVMDLEDPIARSNFRVVIIKPDEVEQTDISDPATARRWKYTFVADAQDGKGEWTKEELWP
ncbi:MAG: hypothetical protein LQ338_007250 [Usnochroma carphineum]|nr:MAG: hypothetical protein LQ338_007250 [Usnochroma carphineum]